MQTAQFQFYDAWCSSDFGHQLLARWDMFRVAEDKLGRYARGKRQGQLRGRIEWLRCTEGGSVSGYGVVKPGILGYRLTTYSGECVYSFCRRPSDRNCTRYASEFFTLDKEAA